MWCLMNMHQKMKELPGSNAHLGSLVRASAWDGTGAQHTPQAKMRKRQLLLSLPATVPTHFEPSFMVFTLFIFFFLHFTHDMTLFQSL
ncbi:hypothetical protein VNO77_01734 [Canavalia gladiata]|uniref:Uncharacterized protein n=1 Tax=Canavalia gladiata TaxID=3824 RepID=A0AAN9MWQ5_CANGL